MLVLRFLLGLILAVFVQAFALWIMPGNWWVVDPFLLFVVAWSLSVTPAVSLVVGTGTGLVQDAWSGGVYGLHGFADTSTAWLVAQIRQRFVIQQPLQFALLFALAAVVQQIQLACLSYLVLPQAQMLSPIRLVLVVIANAVLGSVLLASMNRVRRTFQERNQRRQKRLGIDLW